jgi:hypothetical protein
MLALGIERVGIESSRARRTRSVCVVALLDDQTGVLDNTQESYPNGSPTTRNATSTLSASLRISSLDDSTISRSAMITSRP